MSEHVIKINQLGKSYLIGHNKANSAGYASLRESMANGTHALMRKTRDMLLGKPIVQGDEVEEFWALNNVSFDVQQGDCVGIVGRNGAGKSTLLKILSRITEPSAGNVSIRGRVASLLEVGTGFHPELTGRENIFLNGAILGMSRREINRKFDRIVDFSEVEKFLDTPVKRYSSGMYVRLAFAVAAHLEPEILVVDEVLAVGDARFQKKCMGRMGEVGKEGRTVLFVSHNMGAVSELCNRAILLADGKLVADGSTASVIEKYLQAGSKSSFIQMQTNSHHPVFVTQIRLADSAGESLGRVELGEDAVLEIGFTVEERLSNVNMAVLISRSGASLIFSHDNDLTPVLMDAPREPGNYVARITLPLSRFKEGNYSIEVHVGAGATNMTSQDASIAFDIENYEINTNDKGYRADRPGHLYWPLQWDISKC
jgi:lipopolysaccharide transport system ATP-binding protein